MSCDKCEDIHIAQREGKQSDECHCSCHNGFSGSWHWDYQPLYQPFQPYTGDPLFRPSYTTCTDDTKTGKWVV